MPLTFGDHCKQLIERFPQCEWHRAESLVWQAHLKVYREFEWPFCVKESRITTEAAYTTGTVAVTNGSTALTFSGATLDPTWTYRRIVISGRSEDTRITILTSSTATLEFAWVGDDDGAAEFRIYRDEYTLPADCDYGREYFLLDPARSCALRYVDYGFFALNKAYNNSWDASFPTFVTRASTTSTGASIIRFGPTPPATVESYPLIYFAMPVKPASGSQVVSPVIPPSFEDLPWRRAQWLYAEQKGKSRTDAADLRAIYYDNYGAAVKAFEGGSEVRRIVATAYPATYPSFLDNLSAGMYRAA